MEFVKELKVTVRQFLTKDNPSYPDRKPVPMRTMFGYAKRESAKGIYMVLRGKPVPSTVCLHCGRKLTHPVSLLYGLGPHCGEHYHISPYETEEELNDNMEELRNRLADVTWEGWLPKNYITFEETGEMVETIKEIKEVEKPKELPKIVEPDSELVLVLAEELNKMYR